MQRRHWKRLMVGWVLAGMLLSTPAVAQYCYSGGCSSDDGGGLGLKPWMILVYIASSVLSAGELEGCRRDVRGTLGTG